MKVTLYVAAGAICNCRVDQEAANVKLRVIVRDYDVDGVERKRLLRDENGKLYSPADWTPQYPALEV